MKTKTDKIEKNASIWSKVLAFIKAYETAMDTPAADYRIAKLDNTVVELGETLSRLEARFG